MFMNIEFEIDLFSNKCETMQTKQHTIKHLIYKTVFNDNYIEKTAPAIYSSCWCYLVDVRVYRYMYLNWQNNQHVINTKLCGRCTVDPGNECTVGVE